MRRHLVTLEVRERPATWATAAEPFWKQAVRKAVAVSGVEPVPEGRYAVRIAFRTPIPRTVNDKWDLDNLAKPTLDAMEGVFGARPVRGRMVAQPADDRVDYLELSKRTVQQDEEVGASIDVWIIT